MRSIAFIHVLPRILDPFLYDLNDPAIRRSSCLKAYNGREIPSFMYERPIDQRYIHHVLNVLLSVVKFGGQGFSKIARISPVTRGTHTGLMERLDDGESLCDVFSRFLIHQ